MSEVALRDNKVSESPKMNGSLSNGNCIKSQVEGTKENTDEKQSKGMTSLVVPPVTAVETENCESLLANSEIEYTDSEDLKDVDDVEDCLKVRTFSMQFHIS